MGVDAALGDPLEQMFDKLKASNLSQEAIIAAVRELDIDLVLTAHGHGYDALGIADVNSMAGVVRLHTEAKTLKLRPLIGCRIETVEGLAFLAYPEDRAAYAKQARFLASRGFAHDVIRRILGAGDDD